MAKTKKTKIKKTPTKKLKASSRKKKSAKKSVDKKTTRVSHIPSEKIEIIEPNQATIIHSPSLEDDPAPEYDHEPGTDDAKALTPTDPVARYMAEVRKYPLLSKDEERRLAKLYYDTGDRRAAEALVTSNLRFVVKVAAEYAKFGAKLIDLVQEGNIGLMHAVKEFNPYKGVRLITYAVWWIRGYIQEYLMRQYSMVRIGTTANQRKLFYQLQKEREALERMGAEQGIAQLSGRLGIPEDEVQSMQQRLSGRDVSLDQPVGDAGNTSLLDYQKDNDHQAIDDQIGHAEELSLLTQQIEKIRPELNEREVYILESRLLADEPLTLQEIGDKFGITREAVRQMENRLIGKIKKNLETELDKN